MFLKSLEIQGFKSFPDRTRLSFGQGITAVVGPNGSGKSNISDAVRWVLGEQSTKSLRGSRMEDVIFGGTVTRKAQGFAEVSLTIDNGHRELNLESDEVTVTRRYYRSGESEYLLNKNVVRLRDVVELFMDTGLGRDGYSIIGQGRIAEIVGAKSEDRREIFEEAAGISKYRYKKEESERRLASAEENLVRLRDILSELESRVGPLQEQSEKAKKYLDFAQEKKTLEVGLWLTMLDRQRDALRDNENKFLYTKAQYDDIEKKVEKIEADLEKVFMQSQQMAAQADEIRKNAQTNEQEALKKDGKVSIFENDILHTDENIARIKTEIKSAEVSGDEAQAELTETKGQLDHKKQDELNLEKLLGDTEKAAEELLKTSEHYSEKLDEASRRLTAVMTSVSDLKIEQNGAEASVLHLHERFSAIEDELVFKNAKKNETNTLYEKAQKSYQAIADDLDGLSNAIEGYDLKLKNKKDKLRKITETENTLTLLYAEKSQRVAMLSDLERNFEGFAGSVKMIMRERQHGGLTGIHGPVSKLIKVPQQYAAAVETALGGALQHIVVDNEDNAKSAIGFLKRCNGGRCTFLPLSTIHGSVADTKGITGFGGFIGLASTLIEYQSAYDGIMKNLLGRTLVTEDLDSAVELAKKLAYRFRVVTLDGQIVNAGGSLTGGSHSKNAGLLSRAGEIGALTKQAEDLRCQLSKTAEEKKTATAEAAALEASVTGIRGEIKTKQEDRIRLEGEIRRYDDVIKTLETELSSLNSEKLSSAQKIQECENIIKRVQSDLVNKEEERRAAEVEIEKLGGGKDEIADERERLSAKSTDIKMKLVSCKKDIEALKTSIAGIEDAIAGRSKKIDELNQEINELESKKTLAISNIEQLKVQAAELRQKAAELLKQCESMTNERQLLEQKTVGMRSEEKNLSADKEKISREMARLDERKVAAQSEYDEIISKLWDEYELTRSEAEKTAAAIEDTAAAQKRLNIIKNNIKELGSVNLGAVEEYKEVSQRYEFLKDQIGDVEKSKRELTSLIGDLTVQMRDIFAKQFEEINKNFGETFVELFGGGSAKLRLSEPDDVLSSGIDIIVQPPGKIIKSLSVLSGGEQAFVAIALYFAILKVRPSPFCVLDEIEAALDDANVSRYAAYLRKMCGSTQFIVITHRRGTMDEADVLYGVTMQEEGVSKLLTLNVTELVNKLGITN